MFKYLRLSWLYKYVVDSIIIVMIEMILHSMLMQALNLSTQFLITFGQSAQSFQHIPCAACIRLLAMHFYSADNL